MDSAPLPQALSDPPATGSFTHVAVMGDIIGSESAASSARLYTIFNAAIDEANTRFATTLASPLTITLGDEFQGLAGGLAAGFAIATYLRYVLLAQDVACRFALGVTRIETPVSSARAWNLMGPGLAQTRAKLEDKRRPHAYRFHLPNEPLYETLLEAVGLALTLIERDWTERQREIATSLLKAQDASTETLARREGVTRRNINKIRAAARLDVHDAEWQAMQTALEGLDQRYGFAHG